MNTLRQQLADGTVEESEGMEKLRQLEEKVSRYQAQWADS